MLVHAARISLVLASLALACGAKNQDERAPSDEQPAGAAEAEGGAAAEGQAEGREGPDGAAKGGSKASVASPKIGAPRWKLDAEGAAIPALEGPAELLDAGAEGERVQLRLGLVEGARYQVTTIGMLELPLLDAPTGFAREERLRLRDCEGEGAGRSCELVHSYRNYDAEPPAGAGLEADERAVAGVASSHRIDASGLRSTVTTVEGELPEDSAVDLREELAQVPRLYCIRLPAEAVGVGASWRDACRLRQGGSLVTRELTWRLAKLEAGEGDEGRRAELEYAGRVRKRGGDGELVDGEIKGRLLLWLDAGEPHLLRERLSFVLNAQKGVTTTTDLRVQFAKLDEGDALLRTDGRKFEAPPQVLNDLRREPSGATRDGELALDR